MLQLVLSLLLFAFELLPLQSDCQLGLFFGSLDLPFLPLALFKTLHSSLSVLVIHELNPEAVSLFHVESPLFNRNLPLFKLLLLLSLMLLLFESPHCFLGPFLIL